MNTTIATRIKKMPITCFPLGETSGILFMSRMRNWRFPMTMMAAPIAQNASDSMDWSEGSMVAFVSAPFKLGEH
jgi:hypothetical protein